MILRLDTNVHTVVFTERTLGQASSFKQVTCMIVRTCENTQYEHADNEQ